MIKDPIGHMTTWSPSKSKDTAIDANKCDTQKIPNKKKLQDLEEARRMKQWTNCQI